MRGLGLGILVTFTLAATAGDALAQPGVTPATAPAASPAAPQPLGHVDGEKSEGTALALSLGVTVGGIALAALADNNENNNNNNNGGSDDSNGGLALVGGLAMWFGPTTGHWYAGRAWTGGLTARFVGGGAAVLGAAMLISCIDSCSDSDATVGMGAVLLYGGAAAMLGGALYDIATAPRSAQRHNQRLRERATGGWAVTPTLGHGRAGVALAGSF